ncbi:MAG: glycosyltransferase family 2 protein [Bacteroidota bacterium]
MSTSGGLRSQHISASDLPGKPLVSIITVTYNAQKHLEQAMLSVLEQTYDNIEYIVIDGGSTDNTLDIIRKYEDRLALWRSEPDKGIYDAMNKGLAEARGTLIAFKNADDVFVPEALALAVEAFLKTDADVIYGNTYKLWSESPRRVSLIISDHNKLNISSRVDHRSTFFRTALHKKHPFDLRFGIVADYKVLLEIRRSGGKFVHVPHVFSLMRFGGHSDTFRVYSELRDAQAEFFGRTHAWQIWGLNVMRYTMNSMKNSILKTVLGEAGFAKFKQRKVKK